MKYKKYSSYKDSGIEWLGEIPCDWNLVKLKYLVSITTGNKDTENKEQDGKYPFFVRSKNVERINSYSYDGEAILTAGDGDIGKIFHYINGKFDYHQRVYMFYKFKNILVKFIYFYLQENLHKEVIKLSAKTTVDSLRLPMLQDFIISVPAVQEQQQIANFLDKATAKIDTLIEKQTKQIGLLKEKRQAVISHAVTKGINPNVSMKNSGVEWLGQIPEHWIVSKFGFIKTVLTDYTANGSFADLAKNVKYKNEESYARLVRLTDLRTNLENTDGVWIDESAYNYLKKSSLYGGEFLLANVGAYAGLFYQMPYINKPASLAPNMFMAKFNNTKVSEHFMSYVAKSESAYSQLKLKATASSAQPKLNKDDFKSIVFAYPCLLEQQQIANYLDDKISKIDILIEKSNKSIELLKEKRTAIISAAVTGKIDVREKV
ncbi:restriction endonuclease subunit S [Aliarcobacter sp. ERUVET-7]|uniref:restriction endonuclease subunit S n=1 Tax=Aliarcobacter sp. ERUVET-7 TaxID=3429683 RepID=UPI003D6C6756